MPEIKKPATPSRYVVSTLLADNVGIMNGITSTITDLGGNIEGISQTVVHGYFTVVLIASFTEPVGADIIREKIAAAFSRGKASVLVREFHEKPPPNTRGSHYILTLLGREGPGILKMLTAYLAGKNINIEDWYFRVEGKTVTHIGEITVPPQLDIRQVQDDLRALLEPRDLHVHCRHENLFRATSEVKSIRLLPVSDQPELFV